MNEWWDDETGTAKVTVPAWLTHLSLTADADARWRVLVIGDPRGTGSDQVARAVADTPQEAVEAALDECEGWRSFRLIPAAAGTSDATEAEM